MKRGSYIGILFLLLLFNQSFATPDILPDSLGGDDKVDYTDFIPKYRKLNNNFLITKIDYTKTKTILHFRYIAERDKEPIHFYGADKPEAWALTTNRRPGTIPLQKPTAITNIRINNQLQLSTLPSNEAVQYAPQRGDIVSCEIQVENLPSNVKVVNLTGGERDKDGKEKFTCLDILLKSSSSPMLGNPKQMTAVIDQFYAQFKYVRYPDIKSMTSLSQESIFEKEKEDAKTRKAETPVQAAMEPVDYMPKMLNSVVDLECRERLILKNVYFEDNKTEISRKIQAHKTLNMVIEYMERYPNSKIVLHGHTDIFGDQYRNLMLSKERVMTIKRYFALKGVDKRRIITLYHGGSQPLPLYKSGGAMNRRVEVEVICSGSGPNQ